MRTETQQIRSENTSGSFPELRSFHSMAVRGIGVLADVSGGLFDGEARPEPAIIAQLSGLFEDDTFPAAA